jgi:hypothetical protein
MPKPIKLTPDEMNPSATHTPAGVMSPRGAASMRSVALKPERKITEPLQLRLPPPECIEIKVDATRRGMSQSDFMLACYHTCKENDLLPSGKMLRKSEPHGNGVAHSARKPRTRHAGT